MADSITPILGLTKPEPGASADSWGGKLNDNFDILDTIGSILYPVGSVYTNVSDSTNPATLLGFGTWSALASGRVLVGDGGGYTAGSTGGSADAIVVSHTHTATSTFTGSALGTHSHTLTDPGHTHRIDSGGTLNSNVYNGGVAGTVDNFNNAINGTDSATTGISIASASAGTPSGSVSTTVSSTGNSATGANMQPYLVVYMWKRTA